MDSLTHILIGIGIAGLAQFHPEIAASPLASQAIVAASLIGSVFPDIDTLYRVKGNGTYLRQHRGYTHSVPFLVGSTLGISAFVSMIYPGAVDSIWILVVTTFALFIHVLTDVLNAYGTQIMRPFSKRRTAFNILPVFDPIIFVMHLLGIYAWLNGSPAHWTSAVLYLGIIGYVLWRWRMNHHVMRRIGRLIQDDDLVDSYWALPTTNPFCWQIGIRSIDGTFQTGKMIHHTLQLEQQWRSEASNHPAVAIASSHDSVQALLEFTPHNVVQIQSHPRGTEVRYLDVRYQYRKKYPLVASIVFDEQMEPIHSFVGWSDHQSLQKRQLKRKRTV